MHPTSIFTQTLDDISNVIETPDNYGVLRSSALLRQLLVDRNRLVDVINRGVKVKILFRISDGWDTPYTKLVLEDDPVFFAVLDGLSPNAALLKGAPIKELSRDEFLSHRVVLTNGRYITVRDIIDHCANVMGGVHLGAPKQGSQKSLSNLQNITVGGAPLSIRQLLPILRVVHDALQPLYAAVNA